MTNPRHGIRLVLAAALLGSVGLLAGCGSDPTTQTTTTSTERSTTMVPSSPVTTVTSTQTQQYKQ